MSNVFEIIKAIVYGIVEGITEWLPVSSTGHLILLEQLLPLNVSEDFMSMFDVVIQLGAIMAVVLLFWKKIWPFRRQKPVVEKNTMIMWVKILVACIPAAVVGLAFDDFFEAHFYNHICVAIMLILFGIAFIIVERRNQSHSATITTLEALDYKTVILIGVFQLIAAVFPGTSRSGATIVGALLLGVSREVAAEFTFFLAIPVMFGASLLKMVKFVAGGNALAMNEWVIIGVAMVTAFLVSVFVIRFLMDYIKKHDFTVFGWYRIVLGIIVLAVYLF